MMQALQPQPAVTSPFQYRRANRSLVGAIAMPTSAIPTVFAMSVGYATDSIAQSVSESGNPFSSLGVFAAVIAAFLFMLKRSDGRDTARIQELTKLIVELREELKNEKAAHNETRSKLIKVLETRGLKDDTTR